MNAAATSPAMGKEEDRLAPLGGGGVGEIGALEGAGGDPTAEAVVTASFIPPAAVLQWVRNEQT